jgi:hypothetical protein
VGRLADIDRYYNKPTLKEALVALEELWPKLNRSKSDFRAKSAKRPNPLWVSEEGGTRVGVRVMVLVTHLVFRFVDSETIKITGLTDFEDFRLFTTVMQGLSAPSNIPTNFKARQDAVFELAYENDRSTPNYDPALDRPAFAYFAFRAKRALNSKMKVQQEDAEVLSEALAVFDKIVAAHCATALEVFEFIKANWLEGLTYQPPKSIAPRIQRCTIDDGDPLHYIPPKLAEYLPPNGRYKQNPNAPELFEIAKQVIEQFEHGELRLALISGKVNAGKSGCIVELLRRLHSADRPTIGAVVKPSGGSEEKLLPVFTVSIQDHTGHDLLFLVHAFLTRLEMTSRKRKDLDINEQLLKSRGQRLNAEGLRQIKNDIRRLHQSHPAIFILTNWEDLMWSTSRAQLRDQSKASIIALLHDSNADSRFVVTTTATPTPRALRALPNAQQYHVEDPQFRDARRYLPNLEYPKGYAPALLEAEKRLGRLAVPGDHLILIAAALELCRGQLEWEARVREAIDDLSKRHYQLDKLALPHQFVRLIVERLDSRNLFRIVMAITASDDGLRPSSLASLIADWDNDTGLRLNRVGTEVEKGLDEVVGLANGFFLRDRMILPISRAQFAPAQRGVAEESSWEIYEALRQSLLSVLADPEQQEWAAPFSKLMREAMRKVAKLAFDRAQEWRCQTMYANLTPNWQDLLLDIQAYEALLASIDPNDLASAQRNETQIGEMPLLHHAAEAVFTCGNNHAPAVAVRFAVNVLLLDTVDHDNRMSMCYDQDLMRMKLYMLPFLGLGRRHFDSLEDRLYETFPQSLPRWMTSVFSNEEIIRLLEAIAISALHAQVVEVVKWASERTLDLINERATAAGERANLNAKAARTLCSAFDMAIQLGEPLLEDKEIDASLVGHERTLTQLNHFMSTAFPIAVQLTDKPPEADTQVLGLVEQIVAVQRLRVRRAQLIGLTGALEDARTEFANIHSWEKALARSRGIGNASVLEGRPARIALQIMMRGEILLPQQPSKALDRVAQIRGMLSANAARLARFGGAEQAAALVDRSRYEFVNRHYTAAFQYASDARQFCEDNRVSYGMQIHILLNFLAIFVECAEVAQSEADSEQFRASELIEMAERDADAVHQTAGALRLKPTVGIVLYLKARLWLLRAKLHAWANSSPGSLAVYKEAITEAMGTMEACKDMSYRSAMLQLQAELEALRLP